MFPSSTTPPHQNHIVSPLLPPGKGGKFQGPALVLQFLFLSDEQIVIFYY